MPLTVREPLAGDDDRVLPRLGRGIAAHPVLTLLVWLLLTTGAFAAALGVVGDGLFARLTSGEPSVAGEAMQGRALLSANPRTGPSVTLLVQGAAPADAAVADAVTGPVRATAAGLARVPGIAAVADPFLPAGGAGGTGGDAAAGLVARDGSGFLVTAVLAPDLPGPVADAALTAAQQQLTALGEQVQTAVPGATARVGGGTLVFDTITSQVERDLVTGEAIALPVSLAVLVVVFGGLLAAGLPLLGAVASIGGGLAVLLAFSTRIDLDSSVVNIVTVLGLGLCIDSSLLIVSRFREELRRALVEPPAGPPGTPPGSPPGPPPGADVRRAGRAETAEALVRTMATAGRTVLVSGVTVAISLCGLLVFRADFLQAVGAAGVSVVVVALLVALTLVPALLAVTGHRLLRPGLPARVPGLRVLVRRLGEVAPAEGVFSRLARRTQRHPWAVLGAVLVVLGLLALPVLRLELRNSGVELLPPAAPDRQFFDVLSQQYPAAAIPQVQVVAQASPGQLQAVADAAATRPGVEFVSPAVPVGGTAGGSGLSGLSTFSVLLLDRDPGSPPARALVEALRTDRPDFPTWVTGPTANLADFTDALAQDAPAAVVVVVLATFVLLFLFTGSVLVPLKALVVNVLSLGASLGVLVWVFQDGHGEGFLGFASTGGVEAIIPVLVLALGFGLAMDYEVFLLARIKEHVDAGVPNDEAVVGGLQQSGRIITSAALLVVLVFAGFVAGQLLVIKQTGVAIAVAVAIDATLVRCLLVPATMTLLGDRNWWAPRPLRRLHRRLGLRH